MKRATLLAVLLAGCDYQDPYREIACAPEQAKLASGHALECIRYTAIKDESFVYSCHREAVKLFCLKQEGGGE